MANFKKNVAGYLEKIRGNQTWTQDHLVAVWLVAAAVLLAEEKLINGFQVNQSDIFILQHCLLRVMFNGFWDF